MSASPSSSGGQGSVGSWSLAAAGVLAGLGAGIALGVATGGSEWWQNSRRQRPSSPARVRGGAVESVTTGNLVAALVELTAEVRVCVCACECVCVCV